MNETKQIEVYISRLAEDFEYFLESVWSEIGMPEIAEHQRQICRWLQYGPRRRGVRAFRGASKTWVTLGYCLWRLFKDPNERVLLVSKSESHSRNSLYMARKWITGVSFLKHMEPDKHAGQRDSATKFDVGASDFDRSASFTAASVGGQIQGMRGSVIIADDCETPVNSMTQDMRERLRHQVAEFENVLIPGGDIVFLGTPASKDSLYDYLMDTEVYRFKSWPARFPKSGEVVRDTAEEVLAAIEKNSEVIGTSTWPERFDDEELAVREASEGRTIFQMQFMMRCTGDDLQCPLKLRDLIVHPCDRNKAPISIVWGTNNDRGGSTRCEEIRSLGFDGDALYSPIMFDSEWAAYSGTKMWIDPSGRGADSTGYCVISHLFGKLYCKACGGLPGGYSTGVLEELSLIAKAHDAREIYVESNFGMDMFVELLSPVLRRHFVPRGSEEMPEGWGATVEGVRTSGQKEVRICNALEPLLGSHRLIIDPSVAANEDLQSQLVSITRDRNSLKHEDELEALAMCVKMWEDVLQADPAVSAQQQREQWIEDKLRAHYEELGLVGPQRPRWFQHN